MKNVTPDYPRNSPKRYQAKERAYLAEVQARDWAYLTN